MDFVSCTIEYFGLGSEGRALSIRLECQWFSIHHGQLFLLLNFFAIPVLILNANTANFVQFEKIRMSHLPK